MHVYQEQASLIFRSSQPRHVSFYPCDLPTRIGVRYFTQDKASSAWYCDPPAQVGLVNTLSSLHTSFSLAFIALLLLSTGPASAIAQTDYYNTDAGRPLTVEDAYATERYAFELQLAPLRLERLRGGTYRWGFEPELAYGILPRTQFELGLPIVVNDRGVGSRSGISGLDISILHNLNVETSSLPAFGISAQLLLPVGPLASDNAYPSFKAIATRTIGSARFHLNGQYTAGSEASNNGEAELSRWLAGIAVDRTYPLRSMLISGELFAHQPLHDGANTEWNAGAGIRYQLDPALAVDFGLGKRLTGEDRTWFVTFGLARAFGIRALMPGR